MDTLQRIKEKVAVSQEEFDALTAEANEISAKLLATGNKVYARQLAAALAELKIKEKTAQKSVIAPKICAEKAVSEE